MSLAKVQHYIPQFLLKNFCVPGTDKLFAFDAKSGKVFQPNIRNVAAEKGYYNFQSPGKSFTLEPALTLLEDTASSVFRDIVKKKSLTDLDQDDEETVALFLSVQFNRTPMVREWRGQLHHAIMEKFGNSPEEKNYINREFPGDNETSKNTSIHYLATNALTHVPSFLNKTWFLFETTEDHRFYMGDNPVGLFNPGYAGPNRNLGLGVPGIQITFPLSPLLSLGLYCPSFIAELHERIDTFDKIKNSNPSEATRYEPSVVQARATIECSNSGQPIKMTPANVEFVNSRQVGFSSRFVFGQTDDFALAIDMVTKGETGWGGMGFE